MDMQEGTIAAVISFPLPWPPPKTVELLSRADDGSSLAILADTAGRLLFALQPSEGQTKSFEFEPMRIAGSGRAILMLTWSGDRAQLRLNGKQLNTADQASQEPFLLETAEEPLPARVSLGGLDLDSARSEAEHLFLATLMDIEAKLKEGKRYDLIRSAGLLRQLLLDETPLIHEVNRAYHLKVEFEVIDYRIIPPLTPDMHWRDPDPSYFPGAKTVTVNLKPFLNVPVLTVEGTTASVGDLIRASANAKGGIHLGRTRTAEQGLLIDWDSAFTILGEEPSLAAISGVCWVVLRALQPLANRIVGSA